ncbi:hypothetical protein TcCL_ESM01884 [Trypanosoma cruzi]|nr:hypothetical protein TcCL_ESM01884 [Trypanosoma cruzi]
MMRLPLLRMQRPPCVQESVICIIVPAELAGAARRYRRPLIIGTLRPFFLFLEREKQLFLQAVCWSASILPTGHHAAVPLQCNSRASHCTRGPLSFGLFAGPRPVTPLGGCSLVFLNFCVLLRGAVE